MRAVVAFQKLMSMGNYFLRMLLSIATLEETLFEIDTTTPPDDTVLAERRLIVQLFGPTYTRRKRKKSARGAHKDDLKEDPRERETLSALEFLMHEYLEICNGAWWTDKIVHHCGFGCRCKSPAHTRRRFRVVAERYILGRVCPQCSLDEFSSVGLALGWHALGRLSNNIIVSLAKLAIQGSTSPTKHRRGEYLPCNGSVMSLDLVPLHKVGEDDEDKKSSFDMLLEDVEWKKLAGSRIKCVQADYFPDRPGHQLVILAIFVRVFETVNTWLRMPRKFTDPPKLYDIAWPELSPLVVPHQFLSSLGSSRCPSSVQRLLVRHRGCDSFAAYNRSHGQDAMFNRRMWFNVDSIAWLRWSKYSEYPWPLAAVPDARRSKVDRQTALMRFLSYGHLDPLFSLRLIAQWKKLGFTLDEMMNDPLLVIWAVFHDLHSQDIEMLHAALRANLVRTTKTDGVTLASVAVSSMVTQIRRAAEAVAIPKSMCIIHPKPSGKIDKIKGECTSAIMWYHHFCCRRDSSLGLDFNPASTAYWQAVKSELSEMTEQEREDVRSLWQIEVDELRNATAVANTLCDATVKSADFVDELAVVPHDDGVSAADAPSRAIVASLVVVVP